jgi:hypothetical protein
MISLLFSLILVFILAGGGYYWFFLKNKYTEAAILAMTETDLKALSDDQKSQVIKSIDSISETLQKSASPPSEQQAKDFQKLMGQRSLIFQLGNEAKYDAKGFKTAKVTDQIWCVPFLSRDSGYLGATYYGAVRKDAPSLYSYSPSFGSDDDGSSCVINYNSNSAAGFQTCTDSDYSKKYSLCNSAKTYLG